MALASLVSAGLMAAPGGGSDRTLTSTPAASISGSRAVSVRIGPPAGWGDRLLAVASAAKEGSAEMRSVTAAQ